MAASSIPSFQELTFPVPWGIMAAKSCGDPCASPVLMLHGIQDNAGTFDRLLAHLPNTFYYVSLDLPGHGLSSRLPKGFRLDFIQYVVSIDRVVRQLKWDKFIVIGHSLGGQLGQYYAAMFPEKVLKLVAIDVYGPSATEIEDYIDRVRKFHEELLVVEAKMQDTEPPSYTKEMALQKMISNRRSPITKEAAEKLLPRNLKSGKNGYYFSLDQRLKLSVSTLLSHKQHSVNYKRIVCPMLLVITRALYKALSLDEPSLSEKTLIGVFMKNPKFEMAVVDGHHDVHNDSPEVVAPFVKAFLLNQKCLL